MYGDVSFVLDGERLTARYDNAIWDDLKARFSVASEAECIQRATSTEFLPVILSAGLTAHQPGLGADDLARIRASVPAAGERSLVDACHEAMALALPEPKEPKKSDEKRRVAATKPDAHALRREALKAGMSPTEFSAITPREAVMYVEASAWRQGQALRMAIATAWHTEAFARTQRLKPLGEILKKIGEPEIPDDPALAAAERAERARAWFRRAAELRRES